VASVTDDLFLSPDDETFVGSVVGSAYQFLENIEIDLSEQIPMETFVDVC